jgi:hypothetical protein
MILASYGFLACAGGFAALLSLSQLAAGQSPWGLWVTGAALLLSLGPYMASRIGQRLAADQMELLRCFLRESLGLVHMPVDDEACP